MSTYELRNSADRCILDGQSLQALHKDCVRLYQSGLKADPVNDLAHIVIYDAEGLEKHLPWYMVKKFYDGVREEVPEYCWEDEDCRREYAGHANCD